MSDPNILIGQRVDHYQIERLIGQGGMAAVYLARDLTLERPVVLKTMLPALAQNQELMTRFQREAKATAQLQHPNIVPVYTTGVTPSGQPYMAMQYIQGGALNDFLHNLAGQGQWISTIYALSITRQIADALRTAHDANIIHRDLKPGNILLRRDGTPVLTDLGIAAVQQATTRLTQTGSIIGTPNYMSPEQATGKEIDGRSDIYSLGIILYELLSGQLPFDADSPWAIIHKHIYEQPAPLEQVRPDLTAQTVQLVSTCLQKEPAQRFQTAAALVTALDAAMAAEGGNPQVVLGSWQPPDNSRIVQGPPTTRPSVKKAPPTPRPTPQPAAQSGKRPFWHYGLIFVALIIVVGGVFALRGPRLNVVSGETPSPVPPTNTPSIVTVIATPALSEVEVAVPATEVPTAASAATTVPELIETAEPALLPTATAVNPYPDGFLAYSCGNGSGSRIYLNTPDGSSDSQILLPNQPGSSIVPAFSPDGRQLAYRSNAGGSWQIFVSGADGSNPRPITGSGQDNYEAAWSPDGRQLAFVSDRGGSRQIYVMNSDGSGQRPLTANNAYNDDPSWSVSGSIIFESDLNGRFSIFQISSEGGVPVELIAWGESSSTPAWSKDGQWLAFESRTGDSRHIWIARSDGRDIQQVTALGSADERPAWSPDGTKIAFHSNYLQADTDSADIWIIDVTTRAVSRLTTQGNCYNPAWAIIPAELAAVIKPVSGSPAGLPVSETGIVACFGVMDTDVTAGDNARLWSQPDVSNAQLVRDVASGTSLRLVSGPVWGRVRLDTNDAGWWYEVEIGGATGWVWQSRLVGCGP